MKLGLAPLRAGLVLLGLAALASTGCSPSANGGSRPPPASVASPSAAVVATPPVETPESRKIAAQELACRAGDVVSCVHAGEAYDAGLVAAPDEARARALWTRACEAADAAAKGSGTIVTEVAASSACLRLEAMSERARPFERAVVRTFHVGHTGARGLRAKRSPDEARKLAAQAAAELDAGAPFEEVADRYVGETPAERSIDRPSEKERVVFRKRPDAKRQEPGFSVQPRRATVSDSPLLGFLVSYRVR